MNKSRVTKDDTLIKAINKFAAHIDPISTIFIGEALNYYCNAIVNDKDAIRKEMQPNGRNALISPDLWIDIAEEWLKCKEDINGK